MKSEWLEHLLSSWGIGEATVEALSATVILLLVLLGAAGATWLVRKTLLRIVTHWIQSNDYRWDDPLASNRLLNKVSWFVPVAIVSLAIDTFLEQNSSVYLLARRLVMSGFVIVSVLSLLALFSSINDIHRILRKQKGSTLRGYTDAGKIVSIILGAIFIISIFTGKSPWGIISVLGGLTAVTLLVFKDTILGFVASVQLTSTDMVRIGDWIEMPQYGADGDVIDMSINCIRIQNWDKTVTTIPTYAMVSSSFKNWRGMTESGGRRIKRSINIDMNTIRFCDDAMLERLSRIGLLAPVIKAKQEEISRYNEEQGVDQGSLVNGRRQTNVGIFRAYLIAYLRNNPHISDEMTFLVRQLQPTEYGLPLEIYVFSAKKDWVTYEDIQADIFDHILAAAPEFGLRIFQRPSGNDFRIRDNTTYAI